MEYKIEMDLFKDIRKLNISSYIIFIMQNFNISCNTKNPQKLSDQIVKVKNITGS